MKTPFAEQFRTGALPMPTSKKEQFFMGGVHVMQKRLREYLRPFPGAYDEFVTRTDDFSYPDVVATMWEYVRIE
jgi:hypothetical protein